MDYVTSLCFVNLLRSCVVTREASPAWQPAPTSTPTPANNEGSLCFFFLALVATNNPMFSFVIITIHTIKKLVYKHATLSVDIAFRNICWARTMVKQPTFMSKTSQICTSIRRVPSSKMRSIGRCRLEFCGRVRCRDMYSRFQRLRVVLSRWLYSFFWAAFSLREKYARGRSFCEIYNL